MLILKVEFCKGLFELNSNDFIFSNMTKQEAVHLNLMIYCCFFSLVFSVFLSTFSAVTIHECKFKNTCIMNLRDFCL